MRIGFNARLLYGESLRGINRYSMNLLAELAGLGVELVLYSDRALSPEILKRLPEGSYRIVTRTGLRYPVWLHGWLPRQCARDRVDLLHSPMNFGLPLACPCPRVLTLHDAIDWIYYLPRTSWQDRLRPTFILSWLDHWIARTRAEHIITVSHHARADLIRHLRLAPWRVQVVHEAADPLFLQPVSIEDRRRVRQVYGLDRPYVFYVGGWEQRKNVPFLLRAFAEANLPQVELVLAGGQADRRAELQTLAKEGGMGQRLHILGFVPEADLPALYAEALCFVYPSEYEGFGLQACEAMAVGCPVLVSNVTSLPEVVGEGGVTFPLNDPTPLAQELEWLARQPERHAELSQRARRRAAEFSWRRTAEETLAIYRAVLKKTRASSFAV